MSFVMKIGIFASGFKGLKFLENFHSRLPSASVKFVCSYSRVGDLYNFFENIQTICSDAKYQFYTRKELPSNILAEAEIIFVVGWQYIIHNSDQRYIIFHDSMLPKYRGFAPTVTALINGDLQIGVTALKAAEIVDRGDIYEQRAIEISYPIKIQEAYALIAKAYVTVATSILDKTAKNMLIANQQCELNATYSIWRDEDDYCINWDWDATKILRFINAVGYPYKGAQTTYQSEIIYIDEASIIEDLFFEDRHSGKIWSVREGYPDIVCGQGMIKILSARDAQGMSVKFDRLRERLGNKHRS
jgi:methionyl-tRNA formyltransferase